MGALASLRRHPVYRDALICQLIVLMLAAMSDADDLFAVVELLVWILFWVGLVCFVRFRVAPTKAELLFARLGPLLIFILMFVIAQYI
jgi:hypothetical protein